MSAESPEIWKPVTNFPNYFISSHGRVKSFKHDPSGKILTGGCDTKGYPRVRLWREKKVSAIYVHTLVCTFFNGKKPSPIHQVCHNDGSKTNNHFKNLRWGTALENAHDRYLHGTAKLSKANSLPLKKIIEEQVFAIMAEYHHSRGFLAFLKSLYKKIWKR